MTPATPIRMQPEGPEYKPSLRQALFDLIAANAMELSFNAGEEWEGPNDRRDIELHHATLVAREHLYAAFARHGIGRAFVDQIGGLL